MIESPPMEKVYGKGKGKGKEKEGMERRFPEEEDEDILRESNSRFVLFPIRYRAVRRMIAMSFI